VDELNNQQKNMKVEKMLKEESVTLDILEDFVELVTSYKCRICPFATPDQQELLQHFRFQHMQVRIKISPLNVLMVIGYSMLVYQRSD
jgi:hypothetical protein